MSAATASGARRAAPRRATSPPVPRRVSGPASARPAARSAPQHSPTVGARALAVVRSLPNHSLIDRLVRGRAWIPVLGVLLAGIVATQVEILKLGTGFGRSLDRTTALQSQNELLQARVASLDDPQRITTLARSMGMVMPSAQLLKFVTSSSRGQLGRAIANIQTPDPADFAQQLASQIQAADLSAPSTTATTSSSAGASGSLTSAATTSTPSAPGSESSPGSTTGDAATTTPTTTAPTPATDGTTAAGPTTTDGTTAVGTAAAGTTTTATGAAGLAAAPNSQSGNPAGG